MGELIEPRVLKGFRDFLPAREAERLAIIARLESLRALDERRATVLASTFSASLEMVREGHIELRQSGPFEPVYIRKRQEGGRDGG